MATYKELRTLFGDSDLMERTEVAVVIAANNMLAGTPTAAQKAWAAEVFMSPLPAARKALMAVLASNKSVSIAQIQGASDSAIQGQVDAVASVLVDALAGG